MTIPFQNLPDTRPGYAFQGPGDVGAMAGGMNEVLQALMAKVKQDQIQQQIDLEGQQQAQNAQYQQGLLGNEQSRQAFELQKYLMGIQQDQAVGQALAQFATPEDATARLPFGVASTTSVPMGKSLAEIVASAPASVRATVAEKAKPLQEEREAKAKVKKEETAQQEFVKSLPPEAQRYGRALVEAKKGTLPTEMLNKIWDADFAGGLSPTAEKEIDRALTPLMGPGIKEMPKLEKMAFYRKMLEERFQLIFRPPEQGQRLRPVPNTFKTVITGNEMAVNKIDQILTDLGYDPETGEDVSGQYAGSTAGERIRNLRGAMGMGNILGRRKAQAYLASDPDATKVLDAINQQRSITIYRQAGKVITPNESKLLGWVVNTDMGVPTVVNRLMAQKKFAVEETDITRGLHPEEEYMPIPSFRKRPTPLRASQLPGAPVFKP